MSSEREAIFSGPHVFALTAGAGHHRKALDDQDAAFVVTRRAPNRERAIGIRGHRDTGPDYGSIGFGGNDLSACVSGASER